MCAALVACAAPPASACSSSISKRPARPRAPPSPQPPTPQPQQPQQQWPQPPPRNNVTFPTYTCPHPYSEFYCLNDAKCFSVIIQDSPLYNCECKAGFIGQRCEYKDLDGSYLLTKGSVTLETASIATGAFLAFVLAGLVCFGAWVALTARAHNRPKGAAPSPGAPPPPAPAPPPLLVLRTSNA